MQVLVPQDVQDALRGDTKLTAAFQRELTRERFRASDWERQAARYSGVCFGGYRPEPLKSRTHHELLAAARQEVEAGGAWEVSAQGRLVVAMIGAQDSRDAVEVLVGEVRSSASRGLAGEADRVRSALIAMREQAQRIATAADIGLRALEDVERRAAA